MSIVFIVRSAAQRRRSEQGSQRQRVRNWTVTAGAIIVAGSFRFRWLLNFMTSPPTGNAQKKSQLIRVGTLSIGGDVGNQAFVRKDAELYWTLLISWGNGGKLQVGDKGLAALSVS